MIDFNSNLREFVQSARNLPEEYRSSSLDERAEIIGRTAGLAIAIGLPAIVGYNIGQEIPSGMTSNQHVQNIIGASSGIALTIPFVLQYGHTAKDSFGDLFRNLAEKYILIKETLKIKDL